MLLLPAFVDGHLHLDKTHWGAPRLPHVEGRGVRERIAAERVQRHRVALPIEARASALVRTLIMNGVTRARSHVDIDNDVGLDNLEAVMRVREAFRDWIDIQLVAFPQSGMTTETGAPDLLAAALMAGADLIGGLDPAGFDGDVKGQLDIVFGLAEAFGKGIDIHLHDFGETGAAELRDIAERTIAAGLQGRVAVSHAFALGTIAPRLFEETADVLARAEVAIMTSCPPSAPVPPVNALRARGVTVFAGSDNIRDCWSPYGNGDMLDRAAIIAERHEMFTEPRARRTPSRWRRAKRTRRSAIPGGGSMPARSPISSRRSGERRRRRRRPAAPIARPARRPHRRRAGRFIRGAGFGPNPWRASTFGNGDRTPIEGGRAGAQSGTGSAGGEMTTAMAAAVRPAIRSGLANLLHVRRRRALDGKHEAQRRAMRPPRRRPPSLGLSRTSGLDCLPISDRSPAAGGHQRFSDCRAIGAAWVPGRAVSASVCGPTEMTR